MVFWGLGQMNQEMCDTSQIIRESNTVEIVCQTQFIRLSHKDPSILNILLKIEIYEKNIQ